MRVGKSRAGGDEKLKFVVSVLVIIGIIKDGARIRVQTWGEGGPQLLVAPPSPLEKWRGEVGWGTWYISTSLVPRLLLFLYTRGKGSLVFNVP